jgi:hypothetical protein
MALVDINTKVKLTLTKKGKKDLIEGKLNFKFLGLDDNCVRYDLSVEPEYIIETEGDNSTSMYNSNKSNIIYKK